MNVKYFDACLSDDSSGNNNNNNNNNNAAAALKRKERFERFNRPAPQRDLGVGRFTRLQAEMIRNVKTPKGRKKKRAAAAAKASAAAKAARAAKDAVSKEETVDADAKVEAAAKEEPEVDTATSVVKSATASTKATSSSRASRAVAKDEEAPVVPVETTRTARPTKAAVKEIVTSETEAVDSPQITAKTSRRAARALARKLSTTEATAPYTEATATPPDETTTAVPVVDVKTAVSTPPADDPKAVASPGPTPAESEQTKKRSSPVKKIKADPIQSPAPTRRSRRSAGNFIAPVHRKGEEEVLEGVDLDDVKLLDPVDSKPDENPAQSIEESFPEPESLIPEQKPDYIMPVLFQNESISTKNESKSSDQNDSETATKNESKLSVQNDSETATKNESKSSVQNDSETSTRSISDRKRDIAAVKELMSEMLDKVVKAVAVVSKAEELNILSIDDAKSQLSTSLASASASRKRKRKSDAPTR